MATSTTLSVSQVAQLVLSVGFKGVAAVWATAIALAESGGNYRAQHVNSDGTIDRGLFQINATYHPEVSDSCAYDPKCAADAAFAISDKGTNFNPWCTFPGGCSGSGSGAALAHLPAAAGAVATLTAQPVTSLLAAAESAVSALLNPGQAAGAAVEKANAAAAAGAGGSTSGGDFKLATLPLVGDVTVPTQPIVALMANVLVVVFGFVLVLFALWRLTAPARQKAAEGVEQAAPLAEAAV